MLFPPFEPSRRSQQWHLRRLATLVLSIGLIGWTAAVRAQSSAAAEETIKKAIQSGQLEQARQLVQKERKNAPQAVQWRFMEGVIQAQQGQIDKAIDTFKQITQTHPEHSEAYNNLGVLYASKGQLETSKAFLEKALQTHPSYAAAHRNLSDVHSQLAKQTYAKALQVDPKTKASAPQLTLLGSMGAEQRGQAPAQNVAALTRPAAATPNQTPSAATPASGSASTPVTVAANTTAKPTSNTPAAAPTSSASASPAVPVAQAKPSPPVAVATPASAPSAQKTTTPKVDPRQADRAAIEKAVQDWAKAWSDKNMTRYYAAYANNFVPANRVSRAQWESDRRVRIVSKKSISVEVRDLQISFNGETASVRFQQMYRSDNLKGSSRKTLDMVRQGNRWLIVRESVN